MSIQESGTRICKVCKNILPSNRSAYCSDECQNIRVRPQKKCFISGCDKSANHGSRACDMHAARYRKYATYTLPEKPVKTIPLEKLCKCCGTVKPLEDFTNLKASFDGKYTYCRDCVKKIAKRNYKLNGSKWIATQKKYYQENKDKHAFVVRRWYEANREQYLLGRRSKYDPEKKRTYFEANREIISERSKKYRERNKDKIKAYRRANRHKSREYANRRRARILNNGYEPYSIIDIFNRDDGICCICGKFINIDTKYPDKLCFTIQHILPISKGGSDTSDNVAPAHLICNLKQWTKPMEHPKVWK